MEPILRTLRQTLILSGCLLAALSGNANNIQTTNGVLTGITGSQMFVQFDLSWENSWRIAPDRWDAAWVFVKYRSSDGLWRHAYLENSGHVAPSGATILPGLVDPASAFNGGTNPAVGVFIYRSAAGSGTFTTNGLQLLWNYSAYGIVAADVQEVRVFAIEMVHVPEGPFAAGSGGAEVDDFILTTINTANANTAPSGTGSIGGQAGGFPTGQAAPTNANWPNGYSTFYCMKYEVTQQGYVDFLNTLTYVQQVTRTATSPTSAAGTGALNNGNNNRNGIDVKSTGVASTIPAVYACNFNGNTTFGEAQDGKDIACNYLSWGDLTAYLDWSGLRPMTELEFEKACRGNLPPVVDEYPWGTASIEDLSIYVLGGSGTANEGITTATYRTSHGNANYDYTSLNFDAPFRVGAFAANQNNNGRVSAGASYYGIMELAGNVWERPVTIGNANGRAFTGIHGNGVLVTNGNPDVTNWPDPGTASGAGLRCGSFGSDASNLRVSSRFNAANIANNRSDDFGGRGVRAAP